MCSIDNACADCGGYDLVHDQSTADTVCRSCGRVNEAGATACSYADTQRTAEMKDGGASLIVSHSEQGRRLNRTARRKNKSDHADVHHKDSKWITDTVAKLKMPGKVAVTAIAIAKSMAERPYWIRKKNNNLLGVCVACIFHATVIEGIAKDPMVLADACGVLRKSVKNMISATQPGHDDVAKTMYRGCRHRSWPARTCIVSMIPEFLASMEWMSSITSRRLICACRKIAEGLGNALDNHCPKTIMAGVVSYSIWSQDAMTKAVASELTGGESGGCEKCASSPAGCCDDHVRLVEIELAKHAGIAVATMRQTCDKARAAISAADCRLE